MSPLDLPPASPTLAGPIRPLAQQYRISIFCDAHGLPWDLPPPLLHNANAGSLQACWTPINPAKNLQCGGKQRVMTFGSGFPLRSYTSHRPCASTSARPSELHTDRQTPDISIRVPRHFFLTIRLVCTRGHMRLVKRCTYAPWWAMPFSRLAVLVGRLP